MIETNETKEITDKVCVDSFLSQSPLIGHFLVTLTIIHPTLIFQSKRVLNFCLICHFLNRKTRPCWVLKKFQSQWFQRLTNLKHRPLKVPNQRGRVSIPLRKKNLLQPMALKLLSNRLILRSNRVVLRVYTNIRAILVKGIESSHWPGNRRKISLWPAV